MACLLQKKRPWRATLVLCMVYLVALLRVFIAVPPPSHQEWKDQQINLPSLNRSPTATTVSREACPSLDQLIHETRTSSSNNITTPTPPQTIWMPAFPGSGSELLRTIVSTLHSQKAGDVAESKTQKCHGHPLTCKTHCPFVQQNNACPAYGLAHKIGCKTSCAQPIQYLSDYYAPSVVLVLRNPAHAIPSYWNWVYERRHGYASHSRQMPWTSWRRYVQDATKFRKALQGWAHVVTYWMKSSNSNSEYHVGYLLSYEALVHPPTGPGTLQNLHQFLQQTAWGNATTSSNNNKHNMIKNWPCVWQGLVQNKNSTTKRGTTTTNARYKPAYLPHHQQAFLQMLDPLIQQFSDNNNHNEHALQNELVAILQGYRHDIAHHLPLMPANNESSTRP